MSRPPRPQVALPTAATTFFTQFTSAPYVSANTYEIAAAERVQRRPVRLAARPSPIGQDPEPRQPAGEAARERVEHVRRERPDEPHPGRPAPASRRHRPIVVIRSTSSQASARPRVHQRHGRGPTMPAVTALAVPSILVVDDDPKIVRLVRTYLERAGYAVVTGGRRPVRDLARSPSRCRLLVVLDVMLPEVDGIAVLQGRPADRSDAGRSSSRRGASSTTGSPASRTAPTTTSPSRSPRPSSSCASSGSSSAPGPTPLRRATDREPIRHGDLVLDRDRHEVRVARPPRGPDRGRVPAPRHAARGRRPRPDPRPAARRGLRPGRVRDPRSDRRRPHRAAARQARRRRRRSALRRHGARRRVPGGAGHRGRRRQR